MAADATTSSSPLTPAIQQALEQAVGDVNDAAKAARKDKKKSKKRGREQEGEEQAGELEVVAEKPKKKKKKKHHKEATEQEPVATDPSPASEEDRDKKKKDKKDKKDKGKQRAQDDSRSVPTSTSENITLADSNTDESSAAFLKAVIAAASATAQNTPSDIEHDMPPPSSVPPSFADQFLHLPPPSPRPGFQIPPPAHLQDSHNPFDPTLAASGTGLFPDVASLNLPDLSPEELLRTIQELDVNKLASVLKNLGDASTAASVNLNTPPLFVPAPHPPAPHVRSGRKKPAKAIQILSDPHANGNGAGPSNRNNAPKRPPIDLSAVQTEEVNQEHAHMLSHVWMSAGKLSQMAEEEGLVYKKGKFSAIEEAQIANSIEKFRVNYGMTQEDIVNLIFAKEKSETRETFWTEVTSSVVLRPLIAVYHYIRRKYHPLNRQGKWMPSEDDVLRQAVADHGYQWEKISEIVGRMSGDCKDRYKNHLEPKESVRNSGFWTVEEENELTRIVVEMTIQQGKQDIDNDIFWGIVSEKMGGKRGRQQCRNKWIDSLSLQFKNQGLKPRWGPIDAYILVHKIDSLNVIHDSEIDWKRLPDEHWNNWSAHALQRRWATLKKSIPGYEEMSHADIMAIMREKNAQPPPLVSKRRRTKKHVTSAEAVIDSGDEQGSS
ncbi:hypothetical protein C8Q75DRAFT_222797 [Abortiporus biennis]|nr:hypothetical protein C8Q75DRAFT_222797 [Abortiporus biennis]